MDYLKRNLVWLVLALGCLIAPNVEANPPTWPGWTWTQTFAESFDSTGNIGPGPLKRWQTRYWWGDGSAFGCNSGRWTGSCSGQDYYLDATICSLGLTPYSIVQGVNSSDNAVRIHAGYAPTSLHSCGLPSNRLYTTGQIGTRNVFSQTYGYFEVYAKMPSSANSVTAPLWMLPISGPWPPELDVAEWLGDSPNSYQVNVHWQDANGNHDSPFTYNTGVNLSNAYHSYAVSVQPDWIIWFFDNQQVNYIATPAGFNQPFYMLTGIGSGWCGPDWCWGTPPPTPSNFSANMDVSAIWAWSGTH